MHMLYNSDNYVVVQFELGAARADCDRKRCE